jgi:hypothetical protein
VAGVAEGEAGALPLLQATRKAAIAKANHKDFPLLMVCRY